MKLRKALSSTIAATALASLPLFLAPAPATAADHGDAPALAQDLGSDINDVFFFIDPSDPTQAVLIATVHGFLVPGDMPNRAAFDENIKFRFEIFNDHVNADSPVLNPTATAASKAAFLRKVKANRTIDVTFTKRQVGLAPQSFMGNLVPPNLRKPVRQEATITLTGFTGLAGKVFKTDIGGNALMVTPFSTASGPAPNFDTPTIKVSPTTNIQFFAGVVDDPFFFDIPAFTTFIDGIRAGTGPAVNAFARARDTFAGYNTLAIAIRIPTVLLTSEKGPILGMDFLTQRHVTEVHTGVGVRGSGAFKTIDRMGNPIINSLLIPFDKRNTYNSTAARGDVLKQFAPIITQTLNELGIVSNPPEPSFNTLANIALAYGDILRLDTTISNNGSPAEARYPNGRRLHDDTVDILLTTINHGSALGDSVANSGSLTTVFPFLGKPNQPLATGAGTDDATRN
jgi:hypothetical protein